MATAGELDARLEAADAAALLQFMNSAAPHVAARLGLAALADDGAVLAVHDGVGWLGFDATLPAYRGRGAQCALIAHRCALAASLGCDVATAETAEPLPDKPVASHRNYLRLGFAQDYRRQNYALTLSLPDE